MIPPLFSLLFSFSPFFFLRQLLSLSAVMVPILKKKKIVGFSTTLLRLDGIMGFESYQYEAKGYMDFIART